MVESQHHTNTMGTGYQASSLPGLPEDVFEHELVSKYITNDIVALSLTCKSLHDRLTKRLEDHRIQCLIRGCRFVAKLELHGPQGTGSSFERCYLESLLEMETNVSLNPRLFEFERSLRLAAFTVELSKGVFDMTKVYSVCDVRQVLLGHPMAPSVMSALMRRNNSSDVGKRGTLLLLELAAASHDNEMFSNLLKELPAECMSATLLCDSTVSSTSDAPINLPRVMYQAARSLNTFAVGELVRLGVDGNGCAAQLLMDMNLAGLMVLYQCEVPVSMAAAAVGLLGSVLGATARGVSHVGMNDAIRRAYSASHSV